MAIKTGINIYIDGVKHNATPQAATQTAYDISNVKAPGESFNVQFSNVYDDGGESALTAIQTFSLVGFTPEAETTAYMNQIGIANDNTLYFNNSLEAKTGNQIWMAHDAFVKKGKTDGWYATGKVFLPERGDTLNQQRVNAIDPPNVNYPAYNNGWAHSSIGSLPLNLNSHIQLPYTYGALGVAANNITVAAISLSNGKAFSINDRYLFGNVETGTIRVGLSSQKNKVVTGLTKDLTTYTHTNNSSAGAVVATIQADNVQRTYKNGLKIGETAAQNATGLPTTNILLHSLNNLADYYSPQSASLYWIGLGITDAQGVSLSNALKTYADSLNITNTMVPKPVMYKDDSPKGSVYWAQIFKSSDFPEFTFTKPYWGLASTDHDSGPGSIYSFEMDDLNFNGLTYGGEIWSGTQSETPWLMRRPGGTGDLFHIYFHTSGSPQVTRLITSNGGAAPHLSTWTDRGTPLGIFNDDNHTGYCRTYVRGSDVIATHLGKSTAPIRQWVSVSTDNGYSFTRLVEFNEALNMPTGRVYEQECMIPFTHNAALHAICFTKNTDGTNRRLSIITLGTDYRCSGFVRDITSQFEYNVMNGYRELDVMHITLKNGNTSVKKPNPYFKVEFDLTTI